MQKSNDVLIDIFKIKIFGMKTLKAFVTSSIFIFSLSGLHGNAEEVSGKYTQAKSEINSETYPSYRILERLMHANQIKIPVQITSRSAMESDCEKLKAEKSIYLKCLLASGMPDLKAKNDLTIWAIQVYNASNGAINATANERGLITMQAALLNTLGLDLPAQACVVAHELAHVQLKHIKSSQEMIAALDRQTGQRISSAVKNAHNKNKSNQFLAVLAYGLNAASSGFYSANGNFSGALNAEIANVNLMNQMSRDQSYGPAALNAAMARVNINLQRHSPNILKAMSGMEGLPMKLVDRTMKDVNSYLKNSTIKIKALSRKHEKEADQYAVKYLANAGIDPSGCKRVMELIHASTGDKSTNPFSSHPGEAERLTNLQKAIDDIPRALKRKYTLDYPSYNPLPYVYNPKTDIVQIHPAGSNPHKTGSHTPTQAVEDILGD